MSQEFGAKVRQGEGVSVVELSGTVDRAAAESLDSAFDAAAGQADTVLLDFAGVDYINSTGIAVIVGVLARARAASKTVLASALSDHYREIFQITRLSDFMTIYDDEEAALAAH